MSTGLVENIFTASLKHWLLKSILLNKQSLQKQYSFQLAQSTSGRLPNPLLLTVVLCTRSTISITWELVRKAEPESLL